METPGCEMPLKFWTPLLPTTSFFILYVRNVTSVIAIVVTQTCWYELVIINIQQVMAPLEMARDRQNGPLAFAVISQV